MSFEDFVRARSDSLLRTALLLTGQRRAEAEDLLLLSDGLARLRAADDVEIAATVGRPSGLAAGGPGGVRASLARVL